MKTNKEYAELMYDTFVFHVNEDNEVSVEGIEALAEIFGEVEEKDRADVFTLFVQDLDDNGWPYDKAAFGK